MTRTASAIGLPDAAYLPGQTARPADSLFDPLKEELHTGLSPAELAATPAFTAALALFDEGYYWEAHELFEAIWHLLPPASSEKLFVQGLIQLANAGLKARMKRISAVARILTLADKALSEAALRKQGPIMAVTFGQVHHMRAQVSGDSMRDFEK